MEVERPRIVVVCSSWGWGGTQKQMLRFCEEWARRGGQVDLVVRALEPFRVHRAPDVSGLRLRRLPLRNDGDLISILGLAWICFSRRADVLLVTQLPEYLLGGIAGRLARTPVLLRMGAVRTAREQSSSDRWRYEKLPAALMVNAEEIRQQLRETPWMQDKSISVVHNGVDAPGPVPDESRRALRKELDVPEGSVFVLGVGRFVGDKRFEWLIDATADLIGRGYDVHTILVGDGEEREMLEQRVARRDLGERFRFAGFREDVAELMGAADIVALPSRLEGMPNVVLEALGLGIAVVATNAGGLGELIKPEKDALISDLNDYGEFLANLERAILDPDLRNRLGQAGLDVVRRNHGWERMVDDMESIIDRVARG